MRAELSQLKRYLRDTLGAEVGPTLPFSFLKGAAMVRGLDLFRALNKGVYQVYR